MLTKPGLKNERGGSRPPLVSFSEPLIVSCRFSGLRRPACRRQAGLPPLFFSSVRLFPALVSSMAFVVVDL